MSWSDDRECKDMSWVDGRELALLTFLSLLVYGKAGEDLLT